MLDPRIYRTGLIVAALALIVLAFSLRNQQGALSPTLAPQAFNGQNVSGEMAAIASQDPSRRPGSEGDDSLATEVAKRFSQYGFNPTIDTFSGRTVNGTRTLENVVGLRPGMQSGSIVVVAARDAPGAPALASASATATLMELARDLAGETLHRTIVLASTSASQGTAGAIRLASRLSGPIDAVVVLGDLASAHVTQPIVIPWSTRQGVASPMLRNTVAAALSAQTALTIRLHRPRRPVRASGVPVHPGSAGAVRGPGNPRRGAVAVRRAGAGCRRAGRRSRPAQRGWARGPVHDLGP